MTFHLNMSQMEKDKANDEEETLKVIFLQLAHFFNAIFLLIIVS